MAEFWENHWPRRLQQRQLSRLFTARHKSGQSFWQPLLRFYLVVLSRSMLWTWNSVIKHLKNASIEKLLKCRPNQRLGFRTHYSPVPNSITNINWCTLLVTVIVVIATATITRRDITVRRWSIKKERTFWVPCSHSHAVIISHVRKVSMSFRLSCTTKALITFG
jgi:hypothetical protein